MSDNNDSSRVGGYLAAFAIGAAIGTGIALLYAPRSGEETRKLITQKGRLLKNQATDVITDTKEFVLGKKAELAAALTAGKDAMREERAKDLKTA